MGLFNRTYEPVQPVQETTKNNNDELKNQLSEMKESVKNVTSYRDKLEDEEAKAAQCVADIKESFDLVQERYNTISDGMESFQNEFKSISRVTEHFEEIIQELMETADNSTEGMHKVDKSSDSVAETLATMQGVFDEFQKSFDEIKEKVNQINGFATQTNLLALNASIEAARAGEAGKGFAVVATEVNKLSQEIKDVVAEIDGSMDELGNNNTRLLHSLDDTKVAIDTSHKNIVETEEVIDSIRTVADKVKEESDSMAGALSGLDGEFNGVVGNVEECQGYFGDLSGNIDNLEDAFASKHEYADGMSSSIDDIKAAVDTIAKTCK